MFMYQVTSKVRFDVLLRGGGGFMKNIAVMFSVPKSIYEWPLSRPQKLTTNRQKLLDFSIQETRFKITLCFYICNSTNRIFLYVLYIPSLLRLHAVVQRKY